MFYCTGMSSWVERSVLALSCVFRDAKRCPGKNALHYKEWSALFKCWTKKERHKLASDAASPLNNQLFHQLVFVPLAFLWPSLKPEVVGRFILALYTAFYEVDFGGQWHLMLKFESKALKFVKCCFFMLNFEADGRWDNDNTRISFALSVWRNMRRVPSPDPRKHSFLLDRSLTDGARF